MLMKTARESFDRPVCCNTASDGGNTYPTDYVSDAIGRRTEIARSGACMTESRSDTYGYNDRSELTNAVKNAVLNEYAYQYDDIGNRLSSLDLGESREYTANSLNQYTLISNLCDSASLREEFLPQFDLDGNQTLVQTSTGIWQVSYNGENRPVSWSCGATNIVMSFDRMGRRVEYLETASTEESVVNDDITNIVMTVTTNAHHRFVYDGYLCVQRLNAAANNAIDLAFGWDPSEPVATRPLWMQRVSGTYNFFYFHDGNKNVSELVSYQAARGVPAHYEYAPFGALTAATTNTAFTAFSVAAANPFRFSSEYADDALGLVYYNYRHYEPVMGRWLSRDPIGEDASPCLYAIFHNRALISADVRGMRDCVVDQMNIDPDGVGWKLEKYELNTKDALDGFLLIESVKSTWVLHADVTCCCWDWYYYFGTRRRISTRRISKRVHINSRLAIPYYGRTPTGVTSIPSPVTLSALLGEIAASTLSAVVSGAESFLTRQDAEEIKTQIVNDMPTSENIGFWPAEKCQ